MIQKVTENPSMQLNKMITVKEKKKAIINKQKPRAAKNNLV